MCEDFLQFFVNRVNNLRLQIISVTTIHAELNYQFISQFWTYFFTS